MPGKVTHEDLLAEVFTRTGAPDEAVLQGPADGEDAAAIDPPEGPLVVSSDPISLAAESVGTLGVYVACNDVAVSGADPRWLTAVLLLPDGTRPGPVMEDIDAAAREVGATVVGGHTEYVDALDRPLVSLTAMGAGEFIPTGGASPGDRVLLTKGAAIEGTAILAADFGEELDVDDGTVARAESFLPEVNVLPDARQLWPYATAMHDPTEGGVAAGVQEIARASDVRIELDREAVPVRPETERLAAAADVDPLCIFGSGSVAATVPDSEADGALDALADADIEAAVVGAVREGEAGLVLDGERLDPVTDDLYPLWAERDE
jgi:hydrogenase expression/formation protein HypE